MLKQVSKTSNITVKTYVDLLDKCNTDSAISIKDLSEFEEKMANQLIKAGYLSSDIITWNRRTESRNGMPQFKATEQQNGENLFITPDGIDTLEQWKEIITEKSFTYMLSLNVGRFLWLVVGAMLASIPSLFG